MAKRTTQSAAALVAAPEPETQAAPVVEQTAEAAAQSEEQMPGCCGGDVSPTPEPVITSAMQSQAEAPPSPDAVRVRFTGAHAGPATYFGLYTGCKTCAPVWADPSDVARLLATGVWAVVEVAP